MSAGHDGQVVVHTPTALQPPMIVSIPWSRPSPAQPHASASPPGRCVGPVHGRPPLFVSGTPSPIDSIDVDLSNSTSVSSSDSSSADFVQLASAWRASCARVCPTATYLIINVVWMSSGVAGIALGNLSNKRYFSILLISVFGLMVAVIYRFFYDLEHMDTTPARPGSALPTASSYPPTPVSRRSLPPCYSSVVRIETPPPSYNEYLAMMRDQRLQHQQQPPPGKPAPAATATSAQLAIPTISATVDATTGKALSARLQV